MGSAEEACEFLCGAAHRSSLNLDLLSHPVATWANWTTSRILTSLNWYAQVQGLCTSPSGGA